MIKRIDTPIYIVWFYNNEKLYSFSDRGFIVPLDDYFNDHNMPFRDSIMGFWNEMDAQETIDKMSSAPIEELSKAPWFNSMLRIAKVYIPANEHFFCEDKCVYVTNLLKIPITLGYLDYEG